MFCSRFLQGMFGLGKQIHENHAWLSIYADFSTSFPQICPQFINELNSRSQLQKQKSFLKTFRWDHFFWVSSNSNLELANPWLDVQAQRIVVNGVKSRLQPITTDTPRDLVLGTILFNIFTNDIDEELSAPSPYLQVTPRWLEILICLRVGRLCRGIGIDMSNHMTFNRFQC